MEIQIKHLQMQRVNWNMFLKMQKIKVKKINEKQSNYKRKINENLEESKLVLVKWSLIIFRCFLSLSVEQIKYLTWRNWNCVLIRAEQQNTLCNSKVVGKRSSRVWLLTETLVMDCRCYFKSNLFLYWEWRKALMRQNKLVVMFYTVCNLTTVKSNKLQQVK